MNKFDNVLKKYITEVNVDIDAIKKQVSQKLGNVSQQVGTGLDVVQAIGTADQKDPIQTGLTKLFDPNSKDKFSDIFKSPSDQTKAIEFLTQRGFPIGTQDNTQQQKTSTQQQSTNMQKTTPNSTEKTEENPTSYGSSTTYGGKLQGV
jgi:hypothetical protein